MLHGTNDDVAKSIVLVGQAKEDAEKLFESLPAEARAEYSDPEHMMAVFAAKFAETLPSDGSIRILSQNLQADGSVMIKASQGGWVNLFGLQNGPNGWQMIVPGFTVSQAASQLTAPAARPTVP